MAFEGIRKADNFTCYNTEDINALVEAACDVSFEFRQAYGSNPRRRKTVETFLEDLSSVKPLYGPVPEGSRRYYARADGRSEVAYFNGEQLRVRTPKALVEWYELAMLGAAGMERPTAPTAFVREVARVLMVKALDRESIHVDDFVRIKQELEDQAARISSAHPIRIMPSIEAPVERRQPLSQQEKLERLQSDSFYGEGGVLEGPDWAWRSGSRAPTGKWQCRIEQAQGYYEREKEAREKHIPAIEALGGHVEPYETFPEYLRRMADELEEGGR